MGSPRIPDLEGPKKLILTPERYTLECSGFDLGRV